MDYRIGEIAQIIGAKWKGDSQRRVREVAFDSRHFFLGKDTLFLALKTPKNDGHHYLKQSYEKGVRCFLTQNASAFEDAQFLLVEDPLQALQKWAQFHLGRFDLQTIGITGSNGKTLLKEWLYQALYRDFDIVRSPKSYNSQLGLPLSILQIEQHHTLGIFEVGISKPEEMGSLKAIFSPKIGIFTHWGMAHVQHFESREELLLEKLQLFEKSEIIIYHGDDSLVRATIERQFTRAKKITFGFKKENDVYLDSSGFVVCFGKKIPLPAQMKSTSQRQNLLAWVATLWTLGFDLATIAFKMNALEAVEMRMEMVEGSRGNLLINDAFTLDNDSLKSALELQASYEQDKVLVLTDLPESVHSTAALYKKTADLVNCFPLSKLILIGEEIKAYIPLFKADYEHFMGVSSCLESKSLEEVKNSVILFKGARRFGLERIVQLESRSQHDTVLEVKLGALWHNIEEHRALLAPKTRLMAMVKAGGYGVSPYEIAQFLEQKKVDYLGVAYADEGVLLRKKGIYTPIMVMNPEQSSYQSIIDHALEPEIYSLRVLEKFIKKLQKNAYNKPYPIHLKLDTGMHRLGFEPKDFPELKKIWLKYSDRLQVCSIFSHLASADWDDDFSLKQIEVFQKLYEELALMLGYRPMRHILNSHGICRFPSYAMDMARIGIGMFGVNADPNFATKLLPVIHWRTVISQIKTLEKGEGVGYNQGFVASRKSRIATLPVGYADGIHRVASGKGFVGIGGKKSPIVGNICMDMMMVEVTDIPCKEGDVVEIFGFEPNLATFAENMGTIPYEVCTSISPRVKRIYIQEA